MASGQEEEPDLLQQLVDSFHTLLDETLIVAVAGDYDLHDAAAYEQAHSLLKELAQSVPSEEASGFNASGIPQDVAREPSATSSTSGSRKTSGPQTDKSSSDSASSVPDAPDVVPKLTSFDKDSTRDKLLTLQSMFAELKVYDVEYSLTKANGDFQVALDDLLNVQYLQSTGQQPKGLEAFFAPAQGSAQGKRGRKKKGRLTGTAEANLSGPRPKASLGAQNQDDIDYIAERFSMRSDQVAPIYHKVQNSQGATVVELLNEYISHGIETQDDNGKAMAEALAKKHRHVPEKFMPTIVQVAGSIPQFADDIAALLDKHFSKQPKGKKLDLTYRLTPLPQGEIDGGSVPAGPLSSPRLGAAASRAPSAIHSLETALSRAAMHSEARRSAAASAAQMNRRGASNSLYRQAAGYYTEQAREQARFALGAASTAADILADQQSTRTSVDLHGVPVHDGVRIARQKAQQWWLDLGEMRAAKVREQGGFSVITGLGRHSAGGVSPLRQAVAAALLQDGWKVSVETGKFVVTGRR